MRTEASAGASDISWEVSHVGRDERQKRFGGNLMSNGSNQSWGITFLRVVVGIVFLAHGWQKVFVYGFHGTAGAFGGMGIPLPAVTSVIVILVEFLGGIALVIGLFTRWAAALNGFDMIVAILLVHLKNGFLKPGGFEHPLAMLAACVALATLGPGAASVDGALAKRE
jgi:putative oxidoreductase